MKNEQQVLVYLPFEDQNQVVNMLKPLTEYQFSVYGPGLSKATLGHIHTHPLALKPFKTDLASCSYVLSNAGFELISEALQLKKRIMVKPLQGQMEQQSNALALQQLRLATRSDTLNSSIVANWLGSQSSQQFVHYPNVAKAICDWLLADTPTDVATLSKQLWQ